MLIQFKVGNYLSFKNPVIFSMKATSIREHSNTNVFTSTKNIKLLRTSAIYGANASGKSNLIDALKFMRYFVVNSSMNMHSKEEIPVVKFKLSTDCDEKPSEFEIIILKNETYYRYGFEANRTEVISEWLYRIPSAKRKEELLFLRDRSEFRLEKGFSEGIDLDKKTRMNALFISVVAQFNGKISQELIEWFDDDVIILNGLNQRYDMDHMVEIIGKSDEFKAIIERYLKLADLGIEGILTESSNAKCPAELQPFVDSIEAIAKKENVSIPSPFPKNRINLLHKKYNSENEFVSLEKFDLKKLESEGTKKLFSIVLPLIVCLFENKVLIVDELDASLHPIITRALIKQFNNNNTNGTAQLIFNTHDTNLLSNKIFRRDQIWFTEKDRYGASDLYSLVEYKVRHDASFEKDYLEGRYGSVPFIGKFDYDTLFK